MYKFAPIKKSIFSLITLVLLSPTTVFAAHSYYVQKHQSIGEIFRSVIFENIFGLPMLLGGLTVLIIPAFLVGYFLQRKYISYIFFLLYPILFFIPIVFSNGRKLSDILLGNIFYFYLTVLFTLLCFVISTHFTKLKKKTQELSHTDYIPLGIMIFILFVLMVLPIKSGDVVCKTPGLNKSFNCSSYLKPGEFYIR